MHFTCHLADLGLGPSLFHGDFMPLLVLCHSLWSLVKLRHARTAGRRSAQHSRAQLQSFRRPWKVILERHGPITTLGGSQTLVELLAAQALGAFGPRPQFRDQLNAIYQLTNWGAHGGPKHYVGETFVWRGSRPAYGVSFVGSWSINAQWLNMLVLDP